MNPICEQKIKYLRKYIPCLANVIELLANDSEKEGKLAQMKLLYNVLNEPDDSIQIETLVKCEEVLDRVFGSGSGDEKHNEAVFKDTIYENIPIVIKKEVPEDKEEHFENANGCTGEGSNSVLDSKEPSTTDAASYEVALSQKTLPLKESSEANQKTLNGCEETNQHHNKYIENGNDRVLQRDINTVEEEIQTNSFVLNTDLGNSHSDIGKNDVEKLSHDLNKDAQSDDGINEAKTAEEELPLMLSNVNNVVEEGSRPKEKEAKEELFTKKFDINSEVKCVDAVTEKKDNIAQGELPDKSLDLNNDDVGKKEANAAQEGILLDLNTVIEGTNIGKEVNMAQEVPAVEILKEDDELKQIETNSNQEELPAKELEPNPEVKIDEEVNEKAADTPTEKLSIKEIDFNSGSEGNHSEKDTINEELSKENSLLIAMNSHEGNLVEDIGDQVDESDTFILPDDGESSKRTDEEFENSHETDEEKLGSETELEENPTDVIMQSQTDTMPFKIISAESLAIQSVHSLSENEDFSVNNPLDATPNEVSIEPENQLNNAATEESKDKDDDLDPLDPSIDPSEKLLKTPESAPTENGAKSKIQTKHKDDDDDVLLIESRLSPICIDSDPEDEVNIKKAPPRVVMSKLNSVKPSKLQQKQQQQQQKLNARKTTMETIRNIIKQQSVSIRRVPNIKKPKPTNNRDSGYLLKKDPKALMETINLIDSDSDDEKAKNPQSQSKSNDEDVIIVSSTHPQRKSTHIKKASAVSSPKQGPRFLLSKTTGRPTAQSNFLNAVNLQPAPKSNSNPATFSAQLSNKKVIIPNAFYGNPSYNRKMPTPSSSSMVSTNVDDSSSNDSVPRSFGTSSQVSIRQVQDKGLKEWLEGFLTNFASPLQIASHACFVLLQRVLKYRFFQRLKETRVNLNTLAKNFVPETMDVQLLLDLRNQFLVNDNLTEAGRRFCRFATNDAFGKTVALTADSRTGKVTCSTRMGSKPDAAAVNTPKMTRPNILGKPASTPEVSPSPRQTQAIATATSTITSTPTSTSTSTTPVSVTGVPKRKSKLRKLSDGILVADNDDNDYTPSKSDQVPQEEIVTERKKSLRTNRTKRKEAGFTYSEDHDDEEFEALAKKLEDKKREELRLAEERELEREKEWERKAKKTVAKKTTSKRQGGSSVELPKGPTRKKLRLADTEILGNADDDLLTPTWVEADGDDGEVDSLLDFAEEPQSPETLESDNDNAIVEERPVIAKGHDSCDSDSYPSVFDVNTNKLLKNTDRTMHAHSQSFDFCVHCLRRVSRTVHHYVNEHRSSEVFTSRLRTKDITRLLTTSNVGFVHLYKGNQQQYAAHCIFCDKEAKFLYPYWFEHFTMHTGEYSFKCSGCQIRKPTRSLLTNHLQSGSGCQKKATTVRLHTFDTKSNQIEAHICTLCNYVQLHKSNLVRHLNTQHQIETVEPNHIIKVVLLQVSGPYRDQEEISNDVSQLSLLQHSDDEDINGVSYDESSVLMRNDFTDNDDLSFMICGMLDVQANMSATGEILENASTTNTVDNK